MNAKPGNAAAVPLMGLLELWPLYPSVQDPRVRGDDCKKPGMTLKEGLFLDVVGDAVIVLDVHKIRYITR